MNFDDIMRSSGYHENSRSGGVDLLRMVFESEYKLDAGARGG